MAKKVNLKTLIKFVETRFARGSSADWTHGDFLDLSREILQHTKTNISNNTLKRIFGKLPVGEDYVPQQATIEALQNYSNYFEPEIKKDTEEQPKAERSDLLHFLLRTWMYIIPIVVLLGISWFTLQYFKAHHPDGTGQIILNKTEGILPSTAVFDLDLPHTQDSLFVDFGDKSPLISIPREQKRIAHNYLFSGVFNVTLILKKAIIAKTTVTINSFKWIALSYNDQLRNHYYESSAVKTGADSLFNLTNRHLNKMGLDTTQRIFTRLYNYTPTRYAGEDLVFETTFKNPLRKNSISCNSTQFHISGLNGMIRFKLSSPGCSSRVINYLSERRFDGDKEDLSEFVLGQDDWSTIKMISRNKHVSLFVNDKLLFSGNYKTPIGEIRGIFIEFEGDGFVKTCDLKTGKGQELYRF